MRVADTDTKTPPPQKPPVFTTPVIEDGENVVDLKMFISAGDLAESSVSPVEPSDRYVAVSLDTDEDIATAEAIAGLQVDTRVAFDIEERS
jgi:hypothetical protein